MRIDARRAFAGLLLAGIAGGLLLIPALTFIGTLLQPSQPTPTQAHAPKLLGDAIWARALGGRTNELQAINPFTIGRMVSCHLMVEVFDEQTAREKKHDECMTTLMPGVEGIGYMSNVHMRSQGIWQDPRVPFVGIANMAKMSDTWTRDQLVDTIAARGEYGFRFVGAEEAARGYLGKSAAELTAPEAALLAGLLSIGQNGRRGFDPWCDPASAATMRRRVLERMRDNDVIDEAALKLANESELGLITPPPDHKPCSG